MKVIKERPKARWTCKNCKAVIESSLDEGRLVTADKYSYEQDRIETKCPCCETKNSINLNLFN